MMGLEPMTSPLPRECSTTELHQPLQHPLAASFPSSRPETEPLPLYRDRSLISTIRNAKNPSNTHVNCWYLPGSIVCHTSTANTARTDSETTKRPLPRGLIST